MLGENRFQSYLGAILYRSPVDSNSSPCWSPLSVRTLIWKNKTVLW